MNSSITDDEWESIEASMMETYDCEPDYEANFLGDDE